jgi:hypothetical protein
VARECHSSLHEAAGVALLHLLEENARLRESPWPPMEVARMRPAPHVRRTADPEDSAANAIAS